MQVFLVRHKETKAYMPAAMFRSKFRGWSCWTPYAEWPCLGKFRVHNPAPRIFYSKRSAQNAIGQWQRGVVMINYDENGENVNSLVKDPQRAFAALEIVPATLQENENANL